MTKLLALAAVATALLAGPASAQLYFGGGAGATRPDHDNVPWKAFVGLQVTPMIGGELGYHNFGKEGSEDFDAESVAGTGTFKLGERWSVLGKVGAARLHNGVGDETNLLLGAGVNFALTQNLGLRLEYEDFGRAREFNVNNNDRTRNLGLNLIYRF